MPLNLKSERGVILAGGNGLRLGTSYNKHATLVYDRPMIEYPLKTLQDMGCESALIISSASGVGDLAKALQEYPMDIAYKVQPEVKGTPDALRLAKGEVSGNFPVLCGDVYLNPAPVAKDEPTLYWHEFPEAINHSVWDPETNEIIEKPIREIGRRAIIAYVFDERVFEIIDKLKPSERGELEMVDIYRAYLDTGVTMSEYKGFFGDMGTPEGLRNVAEFVRVVS